MNFKDGDRVKYVSDEYGDGSSNPLWDGKYGQIAGTVTVIIPEYNEYIYNVDWDNGHSNDYTINDLKSLEMNIVPDELFVL